MESLDIAITGMACRFPGADDADSFWRNIRDGVESITFFSDEELEAAGVDQELLADERYVKAAPTLSDVDRFDARFFGYSPREAAVLDPQQRIFLETAWQALEDAACDPSTNPGMIGVYAGTNTATYLLFNLFSRRRFVPSGDVLEMLIGNEKDYLSTRVSYKFDLTGPSISVQTACSTSLVAVHMASQALLDFQCDVALAGGISVRVPQKSGYLAEDTMIFAPDGHCRTFDAAAKGTLFGSGAGVVVLKRLQDAVDDGDSIHAVLKGSAVNNDGSAKVGYTAPSQRSQADVIATAQANAEVEADSIGLIEAHGTGTPLGDPIEIAALTEAFRATTDRRGYCAIGSVKTNVGHLDTAAGMAGLIKTVQALHHGQLPPSLHFEEPNPQIDFDSSPFFVNTETRPWERNGAPRRAGVSSFGMAGTNAHVILEEAQERPPVPEAGTGEARLLVLSAKTPAALARRARQLAAHLRQHPDLQLADVAATLAMGRQAFAHRLALVCDSAEDAATVLDPIDPERVTSGRADTLEAPVVFLFSGQGSQYPGMGADLYRSQPLFRQRVDRCCELLEPHLGEDLRRTLFAPADDPLAAEALRQTRLAQPALFVVEYALAELWRSWGIEPQAMIGHSIGEYVAACLAGVFELEDALSLVAARGALMQELPPGAMLSVPLAADEVSRQLPAALDLAAVNGPRLCAVSGPEDAVESWRAVLAAEGVECRRLHTSHAFHSAMMEPILERFTALVEGVPRRAPSLPFLSNLTGTWIEEEQASDAGYWSRHLRSAVRFHDGVREVLAEPDRVLLEVGPGHTLASLARQCEEARGRRIVTSLRSATATGDDARGLLEAAGRLWLGGSGPSWPALFGQGRRLHLPTYPFERQSYWIQPRAASELDIESEMILGDGAGEGGEGLFEHVEPSNEIERTVAAVWQELLGIPKVSVHDNFFELGGHSLLASRVATRLSREL
ncbi:MAG: acyltransferase domain-containing protein, partial [Holophagales bacterium]|nr:acyltransferase domain-containing protein [Holophagales bacterium]